MATTTSSKHRQEEEKQLKIALQGALTLVLSSNFDADSQQCLMTILKIVDNCLQKPGNVKVRTIRLQNPTFFQKVGQRPGGLAVMQACGFTVQQTSTSLLPPHSEQSLVLTEAMEDTEWLITARHMIATCAIQELGMKPEEVPPYKPPPLSPPTSTTTSTSTTSSGGITFDPYKGHRYDAKSAALGTNLGPDANYVSVTEQKLQQLKQQEQLLVHKLQQPLLDRAIQVCLPNQQPSQHQPADDEPATTTTTTTTSTSKSDATLLASQYTKQVQERQRLQEGGFTTKAMRDLQKLAKQKVYTHTQLVIQFQDGCTVHAKFLPRETIQTVLQVIQGTLLQPNHSASMELYVTPPKHVLQPTRTLQEEGLVPAAKIFCSFKPNSTTNTNSNTNTNPPGYYFRPDLLQSSSATTMAANMTPSFPNAMSIAAAHEEANTDTKPSASASTTTTTTTSITNPPKSKKPKESKEELLLKRMMGRK